MCSAGPNQDRDDIPSQSHHDNTSGSGSSSGPRSDNGDRSPYLEGTRTPITVPVNRPSGPINEESAADSPVRDHHQSKSAVERVSTVSSPRASSTSDLRSTPTYVGAGDGSAEYEELGDESSHNDDDDGDDPFADLRGSSGLQDELSELDDDEEEYGSEDDDYDGK